MVKRHLLIILSVLSFSTVKSQPFARVQFANNCPDVNINALDIYLNGTLALDNVLFQTATAFTDVPAGLPLNIAVAPSTSVSINDTFFSVNVVLQPFDTMIAVANGLENTTGYNPYKPFRLDTLMGAREQAHDPSVVEIAFIQGSTDALPMDLRTGIKTLVNDIVFGTFQDYISFSHETHRFRITNIHGNIVANTYSLPLNTIGAPGTAYLLLTSGFVNPSSNNNGLAFQPMLVPASGGNFIQLQPADPEAYARTQIIHNSGDTAADVVDVYINDDKILDNFSFRTASGFFDARVDSAIDMGIAGENSSSSADVFYTSQIKLDSANKYIMVISGIKSASGYMPSQPFALHTFNGAREEGTSGSNTDILIMQGVTDLPTIDFREGTNVLADDISYGGFSPYVSLPATANYIFALTNTVGTTVIEDYEAQLLGLGLQGKAITLLGSGFNNTAINSNGPLYGLYFSSALGGPLVKLPVVVSVKDVNNRDNINIWPNPATDRLYVTGNKIKRATIYDLAGKTVQTVDHFDKNGVDVSNLDAGIYFIKVETTETISNYKFIKR